jgi:hypothetical protein
VSSLTSAQRGSTAIPNLSQLDCVSVDKALDRGASCGPQLQICNEVV